MPKFSIGDIVAILTAVVIGSGVFFGVQGDVRKNASDIVNNAGGITEVKTEMRREIERVSQQSEDRFTETKALINGVKDSIETSDQRGLERSLRLEQKIDKLIDRELRQ